MNKVLKTCGLAVWISAALADLCIVLLSSECHHCLPVRPDEWVGL